MSKQFLFTGAKGKYNAMKYEMSKETGVNEDSVLLNVLDSYELGIDKEMRDKIIEMSDK
ncbi:MAG: hypothetical protein Q8942_19475 [Bacillota bacterium]|nr:hypothetical protein [Bacillota bacterium]